MNKWMAPLGILMLCFCISCGTRPKAGPDKNGYYVAAFVWPSCHDDSLAHAELWEEGTGEWQVIRRGTPRFEGHYQPKQPLWGYEMDDDPVVVERWIRTALDHGVNTFIYDWYWYRGYPYLEGALDKGFLGAKNNEEMNFYIMWANHDVKYNYWNCHRYGDNEDILFSADASWEDWEKIVERVIRLYFRRPNYLKFDGCPVFSIWSLKNFARGLGGPEQAQKALAYFREEVKKAGFPDLHLQMTKGGRHLGGKAEAWNREVETYGVQSITLYNGGGFDVDYARMVAKAPEEQADIAAHISVPLFPAAAVGWDDTPRFPAKGAEDVVHLNHTPEAFAFFLQRAKEFADAHPGQPRLITINAWNEWVEGSYLLPDAKWGFRYLEAVRDVMDGKYDK